MPHPSPSSRQGPVHERALKRVIDTVKYAQAHDLALTFRAVNQMAVDQTGQGIRHTNWKLAVGKRSPHVAL